MSVATDGDEKCPERTEKLPSRLRCLKMWLPVWPNCMNSAEASLVSSTFYEHLISVNIALCQKV